MFRTKNIPKKEDIFSLLNFFSQRLGIELDTLFAMQCIEQAYKDFGEITWNNFGLWMNFLGEKIGILFSIQKDTINSVIDGVSRKRPKVVLIEFEGHDEWFAIQEKKFFYVSVLFVNHPTRELKYPIRKLKQRFTQHNADHLVVYISAEPIEMFSTGLHGIDHPNYYDRIKSLIRLEISDIWVITFYSIAIVVLSLVIPVGTQSLVNILAFGTLLQPILVLTTLVLVALGFAGIMLILQAHVAEILQQRLFVRLAAEVNYKLSRVNQKYFLKKSGSELVNYFLDISTLQKGAVTLVVDGLGIFLQGAVGLIVLVLYHPFFLILDSIILFTIFFIIFRIMGKDATSTSIKESKAKHELTAWFEEIVKNEHVFKSEIAQRYATIKTETITKKYLTYRQKHFSILRRQIATYIALQVTGSGIVLGFGGWLVIQGGISLGQLIAAEIIASKIFDSLAKAGKYMETYYDLCAAIDKIGHLLDIPLERSGVEIIPKQEKPIKLKFTNLKLETHEKQLSIPNTEISPGEIVGIHSQNRKNAEVLLNVLYCLDEPILGTIQIDDRFGFSEISKIIWRKQVILVRGCQVFSGSIAENISIGNPSIDSVEIHEVLKNVGILDKILKLPNGIHHIINSTGYPLSFEDKMRLNLARGLAVRPRLMLIDETLDFLEDDFSESFIQDFLKQSLKTTVLIYSRKQNLLSKCDKVIHL